jgi:phosphoenolpyruvate-protein kinase (PTS system EI component)
LERSTSGGSVAEAVPSSKTSATVNVVKAVTEVVTVTEEAEDQYFQGPFADIKQVRCPIPSILACTQDNLIVVLMARCHPSRRP